MKLLEVENLTVQYPGSANPACKVSFQVESGELLGIAGASGAGKSTAMLALMGILSEQVQITSEKLKQHGTKAMIFQDASASLNPLIRVGKQLTETILAHQRCTGKEARERAETLLDEVGIQDPGQRMKQYPFELSGGMKQRDISYDDYNQGAQYLSYLLTPATVCLAVPLYQQLNLLKKNLKAVAAGILSGVLTSILSVLGLSYLFGLSHDMYVTLLPKSITTAIGMGVSEELGGIVTITVAVIIITGVLGNMIADVVYRVFRIKEPVAKGLALGTASHAIGTAKAMEMGPVEGAMSSLAIAVAGLLTVIFASVFAGCL